MRSNGLRRVSSSPAECVSSFKHSKELEYPRDRQALGRGLPSTTKRDRQELWRSGLNWQLQGKAKWCSKES